MYISDRQASIILASAAVFRLHHPDSIVVGSASDQ